MADQCTRSTTHGGTDNGTNGSTVVPELVADNGTNPCTCTGAYSSPFHAFGCITATDNKGSAQCDRSQ